MSGENGASSLTREQSDWFYKRYGIRYHGVQTNADIPSRRVRRAAKKRKKREA